MHGWSWIAWRECWRRWEGCADWAVVALRFDRRAVLLAPPLHQRAPSESPAITNALGVHPPNVPSSPHSLPHPRPQREAELGALRRELEESSAEMAQAANMTTAQAQVCGTSGGSCMLLIALVATRAKLPCAHTSCFTPAHLPALLPAHSLLPRPAGAD